MPKILLRPGFPKPLLVSKKIPLIYDNSKSIPIPSLPSSLKKIRFYTRDKRKDYDYFENWKLGKGSITHFIYQTYQEFKDKVELIHDIPNDGIVFFSRGEVKENIFPPNVFTVCIRIDKGSMPTADLELVNRKEDENSRRILVLPWSLQNIKSRQPSYDIKKIGYLGGKHCSAKRQMHRYFFQDEWLNKVSQLGLEWVVGEDQEDYTDIDVLIAFRGRKTEKPPTKLINAWHGGVIPILGNDYGGESLGKDGVDCMIARNPADVVTILSNLITDENKRKKLYLGVAEAKNKTTKEIIRQRWESIFVMALTRYYNKISNI
jgi:hypothetical protein